MQNKRVPYRRKLEGKTNYNKRLELLKSKKTRLVVRKTQRYLEARLVEYTPSGDRIIAHANSKQLKKLGWAYQCKNTPSAYMLGLLIGKKAKEVKVLEAVPDFGVLRAVKNNRLFAVVKGAIDGGLKVPCSKEVLPPEDRLSGKHIAEYGTKQKFTQDVSKMMETFKEIVAKIKD